MAWNSSTSRSGSSWSDRNYNGGGYDGDQFDFNVSRDAPVMRDFGEGNDVVRVSGDVRQVRLTFTSAEVGNGNPNDSGGLANQDGGLAVRLQAENDAGQLIGQVSRFDDEGITFDSASYGMTFDVRDLVAGTQRGDQFEVVRLGTQQGDTLGVQNEYRSYYINAGMGDDVVTGGRKNDFLVGGAGNDMLSGFEGIDSLLGGAGSDTFVFDTRLGAGNVDLILDFNAAADTIKLDNDVFHGLPGGALTPGAFALFGSAAEADDRIIYDQTTGQLFFDADGGTRDDLMAFATLTNRPADVSASDFFVF